MEIKQLGRIQGSDFSEEDLFSYLSQIFLCKTDEVVEDMHKKLQRSKQSLKTLKERQKESKKKLDSIVRDYSRSKTMKRVLSIIESLKREGILRGKNKSLFQKILSEIATYDYESLRSLEEKLSIYLPD